MLSWVLSGKLTYQDNTVAKAILNAYGRGQYEDRQTLAARIAISAINGCDHSFKVNDNAFEVRFSCILSMLQ
ncbi:MAG: hypothetical protein V8S95_10450 [Odoribacter sp.]